MLRAIALVLAIVVPHAAAASPLAIEITGTTCDSALRAELADVETNSIAGPRVRVVTSADAGALRAELIVEDREGRRRGPRLVQAATCEDLASSVAVIAAMVIEDLASTPVPTRSFEGQHVVDPEPDDLSLDYLIEVPPRPPRSREIAFVAGATSDIGPDTRRRFVVGARLRRASLSVGIEGQAGTPDEIAVTMRGRISVARAELTASPCLHLGSIGGCWLTSLGALRGSAAGLYGMRTVFAPTLAGGLRLTWERWYRDRIGVRIQLDGRAFATSSRFRVDNMPVWESQRFEASTGLAMLVRFL
ncbi:MAG: hypothetical protein HOV81_17150 [Kofleriaceae bacterium]|nr:hypothetical protein [Kofleriaceae bacterium]